MPRWIPIKPIIIHNITTIHYIVSPWTIPIFDGDTHIFRWWSPHFTLVCLKIMYPKIHRLIIIFSIEVAIWRYIQFSDKSIWWYMMNITMINYIPMNYPHFQMVTSRFYMDGLWWLTSWKILLTWIFKEPMMKITWTSPASPVEPLVTLAPPQRHGLRLPGDHRRGLRDHPHFLRRHRWTWPFSWGK